jgi:hypothetical protein
LEADADSQTIYVCLFAFGLRSEELRVFICSYKCPNWSAFEFGSSPVLWEPATPKAGEIMTVWFNPDLTDIEDKGNIAFNGKYSTAKLIYA